MAKLYKIEEELLFFPRSSTSRDSNALKYFELTENGPWKPPNSVNGNPLASARPTVVWFETTGENFLIISVIWPILNQLNIKIYHLEVNIMMHLVFFYPAVTFFLNHPTKFYWNIEFDDSVDVGW